MSNNWFLILLVFTGFLNCNQANAKGLRGTKHDFACAACHNIHHPKGQFLWATPLMPHSANKVPLTPSDAMCYSCHQEEHKGGKFFMPGHSHPINVVPSDKVKIPKILGTTMVEGVGRVITCVSCHDPHSSNPKFLKITMKDDLLCRACHVDY